MRSSYEDPMAQFEANQKSIHDHSMIIVFRNFWVSRNFTFVGTFVKVTILFSFYFKFNLSITKSRYCIISETLRPQWNFLLGVFSRRPAIQMGGGVGSKTTMVPNIYLYLFVHLLLQSQLFHHLKYAL